MHDPPFWQDPLQPEYDKWWRPHDPPSGSAAPLSLIKTNSWFHHVQYGYPSGSRDKTLRRSDPLAAGNVEPDKPKNPRKRKAKDVATKGKDPPTKKKSVGLESLQVQAVPVPGSPRRWRRS